MAVQDQVRATLQDRENLMEEKIPKRTGFMPRPVEKLATKRKPRTMINIECNNFLRNSTEQYATGYPTLTYRLWLEAGKHQPPFPDKPDPQYNSNVWRNFRENYGFYTNSEGQNIGEMIASMYPLNIPAPSKQGEYNYKKFLTETPLIKDPKARKLAIERVSQDLEDFQKMRLQSQIRNPPLDKKGNIIPPANYKRYEHHFIPPLDPEDQRPDPPAYETRVDIFGKRVPKLSHTPYLWKLSYKANHPAYERMQQLVKEKDNTSKQSNFYIVH